MKSYMCSFLFSLMFASLPNISYVFLYMYLDVVLGLLKTVWPHTRMFLGHNQTLGPMQILSRVPDTNQQQMDVKSREKAQ